MIKTQSAMCSFVRLKDKWLCRNCGRKADLEENSSYAPSAKCRIPVDYTKNNSLINPQSNLCRELSQLAKELGLEYSANSIARYKINFLNRKSIEWCRNNLTLILSLIREETDRRRIPYAEKQFKAIIRLALMRASKR